MPCSGNTISMERESRPISYQSVTHKRLYSLMHRVDAVSLMAAHHDQKARKASGMGVSGFLCLGRLFQGQPNEAALCI